MSDAVSRNSERGLDRLAARIARLEEGRERVALGVVLFLVLLTLVPPTGALGENEEMYFGFARKAVDPDWNGPLSSFLPSSRSAFVFNTIVGHLVQAIGWSATQVVGRLFIAGAYAASLTMLFRVLRLGLVNSVLVVLAFFFAGQQIVGAEWLFRAFDARAVAYALLFVAVAWALQGRVVLTAVMLAAASYTHFLVGGLWAGLLLAFCGIQRRGAKSVVAAAACYALLVAPLASVLWVDHSSQLVAGASGDEPTADWIYSIYRHPHHVAPFASTGIVAVAWAVGSVGLVALGALSLWVARRESGELRAVAVLTLLVFAHLLLSFVVSFLDAGAVLGKLYLFRPSSVALLLWMAMVAMLVDRLAPARAARWKLASLLAALPVLVLVAVTGAAQHRLGPILGPMLSPGELERPPDTTRLVEHLRAHTEPARTVLVAPTLERELWHLERSANRPTLVTRKFVPTTEPSIREWYRRLRFKQSVFDGGCAVARTYPVDFLVVPSGSTAAHASCGSVVFSGRRYAVIAVSG